MPGIDQLLKDRTDTFRGNPEALQNRSPDGYNKFLDSLATQKILSDKAEAQQAMQANAPQTPGTTAGRNEATLQNVTKQEMLDKMRPGIQQQGRNTAQQAKLQGLRGLPAPNMQAVGRAQGGMVGYAGGGSVGGLEKQLGDIQGIEDSRFYTGDKNYVVPDAEYGGASSNNPHVMGPIGWLAKKLVGNKGQMKQSEYDALLSQLEALKAQEAQKAHRKGMETNIRRQERMPGYADGGQVPQQPTMGAVPPSNVGDAQIKQDAQQFIKLRTALQKATDPNDKARIRQMLEQLINNMGNNHGKVMQYLDSLNGMTPPASVQPQGLAQGGIVALNEGGFLERVMNRIRGRGGNENYTIEDAMDAEGIEDPRLRQTIKAMYATESSSGTNTKDSPSGAVGGMQIMPGTFGDVADEGWDIRNPEHNLRAGTRYAKQGWDKSGGDPKGTSAYYYGGPGGLDAYAAGEDRSDPNNPDFPTIREHIGRVMGHYDSGANVGEDVVLSAIGSGETAPISSPDSAVRRRGPTGTIEAPPLPVEVAQSPTEAPTSRTLNFAGGRERETTAPMSYTERMRQSERQKNEGLLALQREKNAMVGPSENTNPDILDAMRAMEQIQTLPANVGTAAFPDFYQTSATPKPLQEEEGIAALPEAKPKRKYDWGEIGNIASDIGRGNTFASGMGLANEGITRRKDKNTALIEAQKDRQNRENVASITASGGLNRVQMAAYQGIEENVRAELEASVMGDSNPVRERYQRIPDNVRSDPELAGKTPQELNSIIAAEQERYVRQIVEQRYAATVGAGGGIAGNGGQADPSSILGRADAVVGGI
jgi:hypothetical protein